MPHLAIVLFFISVTFLLHIIGNLSAFLAALLVARVIKRSRACGADARTCDTISRGWMLESDTPKLFINLF